MEASPFKAGMGRKAYKSFATASIFGVGCKRA